MTTSQAENLTAPTQTGNRTFDPVTATIQSWRLIAALVLCAAAIAGVGAWLQPSVYESSASVLWQADAGQSLMGASSSNPAGAERALGTQVDVVLGDQVMNAAASNLGTDVPDLRAATRVEVKEGADVLLVTATGDSPKEARDRTEAVVDGYVSQNREQGRAVLGAQADALQAPIDSITAQIAALTGTSPTAEARRTALIGQLSELVRQQDEARASALTYGGQVSVLAAADLSGTPSSISMPVALALGGSVGLVGGVLLALLRGLRLHRPAKSQPDRIAAVAARAYPPRPASRAPGQ
jgi:uncharacterized protein involved in exopolysaccharide biosynthesis